MGEAKVLVTLALLLVSQTTSVSSQGCQDDWGTDACREYQNLCASESEVRLRCAETCNTCPSGPPGPPGPPGPNPDCRDTEPGCPGWAADCNRNQGVRDACPLTCGLCGGQQPSPPSAPQPNPNPACRDTETGCPGWAADCGTNQAVRDACPLTCGTCPGSTDCRDTEPGCPGWAADCGTNQGIRDACPVTCGTCPGSTGPPGPPGPPGPSVPGGTCQDPGLVQNALKSRSNYLMDEQVRFACDSGFDIIGTNEVTCMTNGQWSDPLPTCQRQVIACRDPPNVANAERQGGQVNPNSQTPEYLPGARVTYTCRSCYRGGSSIQCLENGQWETPSQCTLITCADPGSIQNGRRTGGLQCGSRVTFACDSGYTLQGNPVRTCLPEGRFDGSNPQCVAQSCPSYPTVRFGNANRPQAGSFQPGVTISYSCESCYTGGGSINCQSNGQWTNPPSCGSVFCNDPGTPPNAGREVSQQPSNGRFQCRSSITYRCNSGYELSGNNRMVCEPNGQFSGSMPSCTPIVISCGVPPTVLNADREGNSFNYRDTVTYRCRNCYNGGGSITCQSNSRWTNPQSCNLQSCSAPPTLRNGAYEPANGPFSCNSQITYRCNNNYELQGNRVMTCGADGRYQGTLPTCAPIIISCGAPDTVLNAQMIGSDFRQGSRVTFRCNSCYRGGGTVTCMGNGRWSSVPSCILVPCNNAGSIANGRRTGTSPWYCGQDVIYSCNSGYELVGNSRRQCTETGQFSGPLPTCRRLPVNCGDPLQVEGATRIGNDFTEGRTVSFNCAFCYRGGGSITCQASGAWTARPQCNRVTCPAPTAAFDIENGARTGSDYNCGGVLTYSCNRCYNLVGNRQVTCQTDGTWSSAAPVCQDVTCPDPGQVANAQRQGASPFSCGSVAIYNCAQGYEIEGSNAVTCTQNGNTGVWSPLPRCRRIINCGDPGQIENAERTGTVFTEGGVVNYVCTSNCYRPGGTRTCRADGNWSPAPACNAITCPAPGAFNNGNRQGTSNSCGTVLMHFCNTGYELQGEMTVTCQNSGQWDNPIPTCRPIIIDCGPPGTVAFAVIAQQTGGTTVNAVVTYRCNSCYRGGGASFCGSNGQWSSRPVCSPVECGNPDPNGFTNGVRTGNNFGCPNSVAYRCNPGYRLEGNAQRTCQGNGAWTGTTPTCRQITCPPIPSVANAQTIGSSTALQATVTYRCNSCFLGGGVITCQTDGTWSQPPVCLTVNCGNPGNLNNGFRNNNNFACNAQLTHQCNSGYDIRGTTTLVCGADGNWNAPLPTCVPRIINCGVPSDVPNAVRSGNDFNQNSVVQYSCTGCYQGSGSRRCQANGQWSAPPTCTQRRCNDPGTPQNGLRQVIPSGILTCGSRIAYSCVNNNYQLQGSAQLVCGSNAQWDQPAPNCAPIIVSCGDPGSVQDSRREVIDFNVNSRVTYICNNCYRGGGVRTCQGNQQWSQPVPRCDFINCGNPPTVQNGFVRGNNFGCGQTVSFGCNAGYRAEGGSPSVQCQTNGQWSGSPPRCVPQVQNCADPGTVQNSNRNPPVQQFFTPGQSITYSCQNCYQGGGRRTCQTNGQFDGQQPVCSPLVCNDPAPGGIANGQKQGNTPYFCNARITFTCNGGYRLQGSASITCQSNGQFNGQVPSCVPQVQNCADPGSIPNANRNPAVQPFFTPRQTVTYSCLNCYTGGGTRTCQTNGQFDGAPQCRPVTCSDPGVPQNGNRRLGNAPHTCNSVIEYVCNSGYQLQGSNRATCRPNGQYDQPRPTCTPILVQCPELVTVANARRDNNNRQLNAVVTYQCEQCYRGGGTLRCLGNGQWDQPFPRCEPTQCSDPGSVANADRDWNGNTANGAVATYTCRSGYILENSDGRRTCTCGSWSAPPTCRQLVVCEDPGDAPNLLKITDSAYRPNTVVFYRCDNGFNMNGVSALTCMTNGVWSAPKPVCQPRTAADCGEPPAVRYARNDRASRGIQIGAVVTYACDQNYQLVGPSSINCRSNGGWTNPPSCEPIRQPTPPPPTTPCGQTRADIVFVLDASARVNQQGFNSIIQFVSRTVQQFGIAQDLVRVGVVTFAENARNDIYMRERRNVAQELQGIARYIGGNSSPSRALNVVRSQQFTANQGDRNNVRDYVILVTSDLVGNEFDSTRRVISDLRNEGKEVFVVGITRDPNQMLQMAQLVEAPRCASAAVAQLRYYISPEASQLPNTVYESLWRRICNSGPISTCPYPGDLQNGRSSASIGGLSCNTLEENAVIAYTCQQPYQLQGSAYRTCRGGSFDGNQARCVQQGGSNPCDRLQDNPGDPCNSWVSNDASSCGNDYVRMNCQRSCCNAGSSGPAPPPTAAPPTAAPPTAAPQPSGPCAGRTDREPTLCAAWTRTSDACLQPGVADACDRTCCPILNNQGGNQACPHNDLVDSATCEATRQAEGCATPRMQENCRATCLCNSPNIP